MSVITEVFSTPKWLNNEFLEKHLQKYYKDNGIKVISFDVKPATGKGENYASLIHRVCVQFNAPIIKQGKSIVNLILKEMVSDEFLQNVFAQFDIYDKEIEFYGEIAPKISQKLSKIGELELFAESFGVCRMRNILILEDLSANGYQVLPMKQGFNFDESSLILKRLATFHAICAVLQEETPDIFANFKYGHISRGTNAFDNYYTLTLDAVVEVISEWPDFVDYAKKLRRFRDDIVERGRKTYDLNPNHFNTLNHDDLWYTNFMIKTGNATGTTTFDNVMLIDLQFSYWSSPATDLYCFFGSSLSNADRPHRLDELVQIYHEHLVNYLKRLNYENHIPTLPEFKEQYHERRHLGFIMSCLVQPFQTNNTEGGSLAEIMLDNEHGMKIRQGFYKGEKVRASLRTLIPYFDQLGTFD